MDLTSLHALDLTPDERRAAAAHWLREASLEHASVASFARASLQLMALGAPPDLLQGVHEAALDEIRHAQRSYAIASALAGESFGPGPLPIEDMASLAPDPARVAHETLMDGCVNETTAARVAQMASEGDVPSVIRETLAGIADDETRHAEVAWRTLAWLVRTWPGVRAVLADDLVQLRGEIASTDVPRITAWGSVEGGGALRGEVLREVVIPCLEGLLRAPEHAP